MCNLYIGNVLVYVVYILDTRCVITYASPLTRRPNGCLLATRADANFEIHLGTVMIASYLVWPRRHGPWRRYCPNTANQIFEGGLCSGTRVERLENLPGSTYHDLLIAGFRCIYDFIIKHFAVGGACEINLHYCDFMVHWTRTAFRIAKYPNLKSEFLNYKCRIEYIEQTW